jgi:hypothetical protein
VCVRVCVCVHTCVRDRATCRRSPLGASRLAASASVDVDGLDVFDEPTTAAAPSAPSASNASGAHAPVPAEGEYGIVILRPEDIERYSELPAKFRPKDDDQLCVVMVLCCACFVVVVDV